MAKRALVVLIAIVVSVWAVGCGSQTQEGAQTAESPQTSTSSAADPYEGTWIQTALGSQQQDQTKPVVVTRVGDQYSFTDPSGQENLIGIQTDPDASGEMMLCAFTLSETTLATVAGDALTMPGCGETLTVTVAGDTMTWTLTGEESPFSFTRAGSAAGATAPAPSTTGSAVATFTGTQDQTTTPFTVGSPWRLGWTVSASSGSTPLVVVVDEEGNTIEILDAINQGSGSKVIDQACTCTLEISVFGSSTYTFTVTDGP